MLLLSSTQLQELLKHKITEMLTPALPIHSISSCPSKTTAETPNWSPRSTSTLFTYTQRIILATAVVLYTLAWPSKRNESLKWHHCSLTNKKNSEENSNTICCTNHYKNVVISTLSRCTYQLLLCFKNYSIHLETMRCSEVPKMLFSVWSRGYLQSGQS